MSAAAPPVTAAASPAPTPAPSPPLRTYTASAVLKKGNRIVRCDEVTVAVPDGADGKGKAPSDPARGFLTTFAPDFAIVTTKCEEPPSGRKALARCAIAGFKPGAAGEPDFTWTLHHYDAASLERDDAVKNACLQARGTWQALPREDDAWKRARLESAAPPSGKAVNVNPLTIDVR